MLKEDAEDVVELMRESVNQVHMDSDGKLDKTRGDFFLFKLFCKVILALNFKLYSDTILMFLIQTLLRWGCG